MLGFCVHRFFGSEVKLAYRAKLLRQIIDVRVVFENVNQLGVDFARLKVVGFDVYLSYSKNPLANAKGFFELSVARAEGLEPSTYGFGDRRSTN